MNLTNSMVFQAASANQSVRCYLYYKQAIFFVLVILQAWSANSQPCNSPIQNNSFVIRPAVCIGTVALLQGSIPTGGNGTYTYRWEIGANNCGDNSFVAIPGATQKDYSVPAPGNSQACYRRVVISGSCTSASNKTKVNGSDITNPAAPTVSIIQPSCANGGTITITTPAPAAGINYSINGLDYSNSTGVFSSVGPGTYIVTVRLSSGCISLPRIVNLSSPGAITGNISPATASFCPGQSQVLTATGGTSYRWYRNNVLIAGATANTYTATLAGTYRADIISGTCTGSSLNNAVLSVLAAPTGNISPASANLCPGDSINLTASGGGSYQWYRNNVIISGATSSTYKVKQSGTYTVDIIGTNGCKAKANNNAVITSLNSPSGTISPATATLCTGSNVILTANGGTGYRWFKDNVVIAGATGSTYNATQAGTYKTEITNAAGCKAFSSNNAVISTGTSPTGTITPSSGQLCGSNASIVLTVNGGTSYQWFRNAVAINGATANSYTATTAGTYTVRIFNSSCNGMATNSVVVTTVTQPTGQITPASSSICPGEGKLLSVGGGSSYQWMRNGNPIAGATSATYTATQAGTYTVTIISGNCTGISSNQCVITAATAPTGTITPASASFCSGSSQTLTATGGASYQWYKDNLLIPGATGATYNATQQGTYSVDLINNSGCKAKASNQSVITVSPLPSGNISPSSGMLCDNNSLTLSISGGSSYRWFRNGVVIAGATGNTYVVTSAGTYTADIISGNCVGRSGNTVVITQATVPTGSISPASANICPGSSQVLTTGGAATYQWYRNGVAIPGATALSYTATQPGVYTVLLGNGICSAIASNSTTITEFTTPQGSISPASATICNNGSQVLTAAGGNSYQWFRNGVAINGATNATYVANQAGLFSVDVTNSNGCKARALNDAVITVASAPTGSISPASGTICANGSLVLTASGGSSYQWYRNAVLINGATAATYTATQAGTYTVDIINNNGGCRAQANNAAVITQGAAPSGSISPASASVCAGQNVTLTAGGGINYQWFLNGTAIAGATASTYSAAQSGTYSVTIFSGSCSGPASNTSTVSISAPISFSVNTVQPTCSLPTGTITINAATGGSGNVYSYSITNGSFFQTGNTFSNLPAGTYLLIVKDVLDCRSNVQTVVINPPSSTLQASFTTTNVTCVQPTGTLTVTSSGGVTPYQYSVDGGTLQSSNSFTNIAAGSHRVLVKDAAGCTVELNFTIQAINSTLAATATTTNPSCGQQTGSVEILATGGTPGYTYSLDNGAYQNGNSFNNLAVGAHNVKVKDQAGCITQVNFQVDQTGNAPLLTITNPPAVCIGSTVNLQNAAVTNGSDTALTLSYWTDSNATNSLSNPAAVTAGRYFIKATNRAGCSTIKPVVVNIATSSAGTITVSGSALPCRGEVLTLKASSGLSYQWYWNNNPITGAILNSYLVTTDGNYSVVINDGNCRGFATNTIQVQFKDCQALTDPKVFVPTAFSPNKNNANDVLRPILYKIRELRYFRVYNRWGQMVFQTSEIGKGWDGILNGKQQATEAFSWMLECVDANGDIIKQSGRSILIR